MNKSIYVIIMLVCCVGFAKGEDFYLPNEVDLKAAYCLGYFVEMSENAVTHGDYDNEFKNARDKTWGYLAPRLEFLNGLGIISARNTGYQESKRATQDFLYCQSQINPSLGDASIIKKQMNDCIDKSIYFKKIKSCYPPEYLPY